MRFAPLLAISLFACTGSSAASIESSAAIEQGVPAPLVDASAAPDHLARFAPPGDDEVPPDDRHSHANPAAVQVRHVGLVLHVDFDVRSIAGTATLRLQRRDPRAPLRLDSSGLDIRTVSANGVPLEWRREDSDPILGTAIRIELPKDAHEVDEVVIEYGTSREAAALQWLDAEQTDGGEKPFLFTQGQPILTRSWVPLQDSPGIRITWDAIVRVDAELGVVALMSAAEREVLGDGAFRFRMDKPVPPYLLALAVGELESRDISPRCAVWAEPGVVGRAAGEFVDAERMIESCEGMYGPYRWGRQDVLVLPPSFPYGGMENPCLTFVTPTVLAGDRSLVSVIAHELAHSWSGNLVTNATWRDFWLNEGFTVYLEERIVEALYGVERARMERILSMRSLARDLRRMPGSRQILHVDLAGRDPDEVINAVPFDKGAAFLRRIEREVGRKKFDAFLTQWFDEHAFRSVTTDQFLAYLGEKLPAVVEAVDVAAWVRAPGMPADDELTTSAAFASVDAGRVAWLAGGPIDAIDVADWATTHWMHFLSEMPDDLNAKQIAALDKAFGLTETGNAEVAVLWLQIAIRGSYHAADARLEKFLMEVGRRKFIRPLYRELAKTTDGKRRALEIYRRARPRYHSVARRTIDEILNWEQ